MVNYKNNLDHDKVMRFGNAEMPTWITIRKGEEKEIPNEYEWLAEHHGLTKIKKEKPETKILETAAGVEIETKLLEKPKKKKRRSYRKRKKK